MPENEVTEPSIDDLRAMLSGNEPAAAVEETETPAPAAKAAGEPAPASEPVVNAERNPDGTFKASEPGDTPNVTKRIGKLLAEKRAAEVRAEAAEAKLANPGSQPAKETASPAAAAATDPEPESKDFDTYEAYNKALVKWTLAQERAAETKTANERAAADTEAAAGVAWNERVEKTVAIHTDYEEVMAGASELPISQAMNRVMFTMERGPEVAYHLAKNPDECARIAKLDPLAAASELGAIRAGLAKPASSQATRSLAPQLPRPARPVGGSAAPHVVDLNDPKLDMRTFKAEFSKRLKPR